MIKNYFFITLFLCTSSTILSQNKEESRRITKDYDLKEIQKKKNELITNQAKKKNEALRLAKINNWPLIVKDENGVKEELMRVTPDGFPIYYSTQNIDAAKSTRVNHINSGGSLGLNLDGQDMIARVWDGIGGSVMRTHTGFGGRVTTVDDPTGTTWVSHATHVCGTIMSLPWNTTPNVLATKGMASKATARTFDWTNDESEALSEVQLGMLLSNHSYGVPVTSGTTTLPAWYIGSYVEDSRVWDEIAYLSPYYLAVVSAGNDGANDNNPNPIIFAYDKLVENKVSKNNLVIANAEDAEIDANGNLLYVAINSSSSQGPSDDRRIKPDVTGNGTDVISTNSSTASTSAISSKTGTSMAAPNVTGSLLLVQQHFKNLYQKFMRAATLKGLACHTADDAGTTGPDANFGWGLVNAKAMVESISNNGLSSWISENNLNQDQSYTLTVKADGSKPLIASITWTDVPGTANNSSTPANSLTKALVNDLDIRITRNENTYYPWRLQADPSLEATRNSDNDVDNVELVKIDTPVANAEYTITITHKGNLVNNLQHYSLVVTGLKSDIALMPLSDDKVICNTGGTATYNFNYKQTGNGTSNFTITGLPVGATGALSTNSLNTNGSVNLTISNLTNVAPGEYNVGIIANNGIETETRTNILKLFSNIFETQILSQPTNNAQSLPTTTTTLKWEKNINAEAYRVQVSINENFSTKKADVELTDTSFILTDLLPDTKYYWRVIQINRCAEASLNKTGNQTFSVTTNSFTTGKVICGNNNYSATNFSNATIGTAQFSTASVPIVVSDDIKINDLNVSLDITHDWIGDNIIKLIGPAAIGSPEIILFNQPCTSATFKNIEATLDDSGDDYFCSSTAPGISGSVKPFESLSSLNGLSAIGTWTLHVYDVGPDDGGRINSASLNFCKLEQSTLSTNDVVFNQMVIYPNPTKGLLNIDLNTYLEGKTVYTIYDIQGRKMMFKSSSSISETLNIENLTKGVYLLSIENGNSKTTKKIVLNK